MASVKVSLKSHLNNSATKVKRLVVVVVVVCGEGGGEEGGGMGDEVSAQLWISRER